MTTLPQCGPGEHLLPETAHVTPSSINPWRGVRRPDQCFTNAQLAAMRREALDPHLVETIVVRSPATHRDMWWPAEDPTPVYLCPCPVIGRRGGERVHVIAPAGLAEWVWSNGSITKARGRTAPRGNGGPGRTRTRNQAVMSGRL